MWLMFVHGLTVGSAVTMAWLCTGWQRWLMLSLVAVALFNAVSLEVPSERQAPELSAPVTVEWAR